MEEEHARPRNNSFQCPCLDLHTSHGELYRSLQKIPANWLTRIRNKYRFAYLGNIENSRTSTQRIRSLRENYFLPMGPIWVLLSQNCDDAQGAPGRFGYERENVKRSEANRLQLDGVNQNVARRSP
jgi:hypothetical protein